MMVHSNATDTKVVHVFGPVAPLAEGGVAEGHTLLLLLVLVPLEVGLFVPDPAPVAHVPLDCCLGHVNAWTVAGHLKALATLSDSHFKSLNFGKPDGHVGNVVRFDWYTFMFDSLATCTVWYCVARLS